MIVRILVGVVAFGLGAVVYTLIWPSRVLALGAMVGSYALADWLGVIPSAFEPRMRDLMHNDAAREDERPPSGPHGSR